MTSSNQARAMFFISIAGTSVPVSLKKVLLKHAQT